VDTELFLLINRGLGNQTLDTCPLFDVNDNAEVTVDELIQAVNAALNGCPVG